MKALVTKDRKNRRQVSEKLKTRLLFKAVFVNKNLEKSIRWKASLKLASKKSSKVLLVPRCWSTGRSRSVFRKLGLNRLEIFRKMKDEAFPGYKSLNSG